MTAVHECCARNKATGNLRTMHILFGHTKIETAARYPGADVEDDLTVGATWGGTRTVRWQAHSSTLLADDLLTWHGRLARAHIFDTERALAATFEGEFTHNVDSYAGKGKLKYAR